MLKPSTPSASHDSTGSSGTDDGAEYYPHIGDFLNADIPFYKLSMYFLCQYWRTFSLISSVIQYFSRIRPDEMISAQEI